MLRKSGRWSRAVVGGGRAGAALAVLAVMGLGAPEASARALELAELNAFEQYLVCAYTTCGTACAAARANPAEASFEVHASCHECLDANACGQAPRLWEKDGVAPVDERD